MEAVLEGRRPGQTEPGEQLGVAGAAAQEPGRAVVDLQPATGERAGRAAEPGPGLEQGDADARLAERDRSGDAGQAAADHHHAPGGHGRPPAAELSPAGPPGAGDGPPRPGPPRTPPAIRD